MRFDGSASGLRAGSAVLFNGIRMGEVTRLTLNPADPHQVLATIEVDVKAPIRTDTSVGLDFQGLTGIASVALTGGTASALPLVSTDGNPPLLLADASASQDVTRAAREVLQHINNLLAENGSLNNTFKNVEAFSAALARNSARVDNILAGLENLSGGPEGKGEIQEAARDIQGAARSIRTLAENLDKRAVEVSAGITRFSNTGAREVEAFAADGRRTLAEIERAVKNLDRNPSRLLFGGSGNSVPAYTGRR